MIISEGGRLNVKLEHFFIGIVFVCALHLRDLFPSGWIEIFFLIIMSYRFFIDGNIKNAYLGISFLVLFFISANLISFYFGVKSISSYTAFGSLLYGGLIFIFAGKFFSERDADVALVVFVKITAGLSILFVMAWILKFFGVNALDSLLYIRNENVRVMGFLENPNYYSLAMIFSLFVSAYLNYFKKVSSFCVLLIALGVFFSLSRGAIIGLILFFSIISMRGGVVRVIVLSIGVLFALLFFYAVYSFGLAKDFFNLLENRFSDGGGGVLARLDSLNSGWEFYSSNVHAIFFGLGPGELLKIMQNNPHNSVARITFETGVIGIVSFLAVFFYFTLLSIRRLLLRQYLTLAIVVTLFFISLTNDYYLVKDYWLALAFVIGCESGFRNTGSS